MRNEVHIGDMVRLGAGGETWFRVEAIGLQQSSIPDGSIELTLSMPGGAEFQAPLAAVTAMRTDPYLAVYDYLLSNYPGASNVTISGGPFQETPSRTVHVEYTSQDGKTATLDVDIDDDGDVLPKAA